MMEHCTCAGWEALLAHDRKQMADPESSSGYPPGSFPKGGTCKMNDEYLGNWKAQSGG
jgi:hypothetical protein